MLKLRKEIAKTNLNVNSKRTKKNIGVEPNALNNESK